MSTAKILVLKLGPGSPRTLREQLAAEEDTASWSTNRKLTAERDRMERRKHQQEQRAMGGASDDDDESEAEPTFGGAETAIDTEEPMFGGEEPMSEYQARFRDPATAAQQQPARAAGVPSAPVTKVILGAVSISSL